MSRLRSAFGWAVAVVLLTSAPAQLVAAAGQAAGQTSDGDLKTLIRLAEQGDPEEQFSLGRIYEDGVGVERDYKEALNWYPPRS